MSWLSVGKGADYRRSGRGGASARARKLTVDTTMAGFRFGAGTAALMVLATLALAGCGSVDAPVANPAPRQLVRIHGTADPSLQVHVSTQYFTAEKRCNRAVSLLRWLDGTRLPQSRWVDSEVTRSERGYEAIVALDHLEAGECGWHPFVIAFRVENGEGVTTGHFIRDGRGLRMEPAPEGRIWVDSAIRRAANAERSGALPKGRAEVRPLELACRPNRIEDVEALSCVPDRPGELTVIAEDATEVEVNFADRPSPFSTP